MERLYRYLRKDFEMMRFSPVKNHFGFLIIFFGFLIHPFSLQAEKMPVKAYIHGVPAKAQNFSLSCEARSAADWAAFWGVKIRENKFLKQLPRSDNPNIGFVGYPNDAWGNIPPLSYGVHARPVAKLLVEYGLDVEARNGLQWREVQIEIANGRPVIVWVIGQMIQGAPLKYSTSDGKKVIVAHYEHTMILIGYDQSRVFAVDPYSGKVKSFSKKAFLQSWATLGNMAITGQAGSQEKSVEVSKSDQINIYLPMIR